MNQIRNKIEDINSRVIIIGEDHTNDDDQYLEFLLKKLAPKYQFFYLQEGKDFSREQISTYVLGLENGDQEFSYYESAISLYSLLYSREKKRFNLINNKINTYNIELIHNTQSFILYSVIKEILNSIQSTLIKSLDNSDVIRSSIMQVLTRRNLTRVQALEGLQERPSLLNDIIVQLKDKDWLIWLRDIIKAISSANHYYLSQAGKKTVNVNKFLLNPISRSGRAYHDWIIVQLRDEFFSEHIKTLSKEFTNSLFLVLVGKEHLKGLKHNFKEKNEIHFFPSQKEFIDRIQGQYFNEVLPSKYLQVLDQVTLSSNYLN